MATYTCGECGKQGHNRRHHNSKTAVPNTAGTRGAPGSPIAPASPLTSPLASQGNPGNPTVTHAAQQYERLAPSSPTLTATSDGTLYHTNVNSVATTLSGYDYKYDGANYDYSTETFHNEVDEDGINYCEEEGICRCSVITETWLTSLDTQLMAERILAETRRMAAGVPDKKYGWDTANEVGDRKATEQGIPPFNEVDHAALERILVHETNLYDNEQWAITTEAGYYGQEVEAATLLHQRPFEHALTRYLHADSDGRVRQALEAEYGAHHPAHARLEGKTFTVDTIPLDKIHVGNPDHQVSRFEDYTPSSTAGVLLAENGHYRLLDGYHRYSALHRDGETAGRFIVAH